MGSIPATSANTRRQEGSILIFGWGGGSPKDFGPTMPATCPNCHNQTVLHYVQTKTWFRLFFVPVFPYDVQNLLLCPVCSRGLSLTQDQARLAKVVAEAYNAWYSKQISDDEYNARASQLMTSVEPVERAIERRRSGRADEPDDFVHALPSRDFIEGAAWRADPTGRHELRFWDGSEWTAYVSDAGTTGSDTVLVPSAAGWYPDPGLRNETRYWDGRFWTEHVQNGGAPSNDPMTEAPT